MTLRRICPTKFTTVTPDYSHLLMGRPIEGARGNGPAKLRRSMGLNGRNLQLLRMLRQRHVRRHVGKLVHRKRFQVLVRILRGMLIRAEVFNRFLLIRTITFRPLGNRLLQRIQRPTARRVRGTTIKNRLNPMRVNRTLSGTLVRINSGTQGVMRMNIIKFVRFNALVKLGRRKVSKR